MVAIKAGEAERFCQNFDAEILAVLVYGTDTGLISERAALIARRMAERHDPEAEIIRIDDNDLEDEPDRLALELTTMSMFASSKVVRTTTSRKINAQTLAPVLDPQTLTATLVVEAGNLRPDDKLRKSFEKAAFCAALPCFTDGVRDLSALVDAVLANAGQSIDKEAREVLLARLGADRALSRNEIEKLSLYAHDSNTITTDDVEAIVGDASELTVDRIVMAAAGGNAANATLEFQRAIASGQNAQYIISAILNHFTRLHRIRAAMDAGQNFDDAARRLRPPLHFKLRTAVQSQIRTWQLPALTRTVAMINATARQARLNGDLDEVLGEHILLNITDMIAKR